MIRDLLLNEYFYKVCGLYSRLKMLIYQHTKRALKHKIAKLVEEGEMDSQESEDEKLLYPIILSHKAS